MKIIAKIIVVFLVLFSTGSSFAADVELYVVRHGKTIFNTVHRAQGWSDTPLTAEGAEVARQAGRGLKPVDFIAAWSSDSGRARETAKLIMAARDKPLPVQECKALREVFFGVFEGDTNENMQTAAASKGGYASSAQLMAAFNGKKIGIEEIVEMIHAADPSGQAETYQQVAQRVTMAVKKIARQAQQQGGGNVLIVTHGMAIMTLLHELGDKNMTHSLSNASVTRIRYTDAGKFVIEAIDDLSYVKKGSQRFVAK